MGVVAKSGGEENWKALSHEGVLQKYHVGADFKDIQKITAAEIMPIATKSNLRPMRLIATEPMETKDGKYLGRSNIAHGRHHKQDGS